MLHPPRTLVRHHSWRPALVAVLPALLCTVVLAACDGGITDPRPIDPGRNPGAPPVDVPVAAPATPAVAPPLAPAMADLLAGAFSFRPPLPAQATSGTFDAALLDVLSVDVCEAGACGSSSIVQYTSTAGQGAEVLRLDPVDAHFIVNWDTDAFGLSTSATYRIRVLALGLELGAVEVQLVKSGSELKDATGGTIALKDGRTLPVKFSVMRNRLVAAWVLAAQGGSAADVAALLVGEFGSAADETAGILAFAGYPAGDVAAVLRTTFSLAATDAAGILASVGLVAGDAEAVAALAAGGYSIAGIVTWLQSALGQDLSEAAATLYEAGIAAGDAGSGLRAAFGGSLEDGARALHDAGYAVGDVADWLLAEPDSPGSPAVIGLLRLAGFGLADVIGYLESTGVQGPEALAAALLGAGFTLDDVGDWLVDDGASAGVAAALLRRLGQPAGAVGDWLLARGASDEETVAALRDGGYTAAETGDWLADQLGRTLEEAGLLLAGGGHVIADVGDWLFDRFTAIGGQPLEKSTAILKKAGSLFDGIADWVFAKVGGLDQTDLEEAASILHDVGYAWMDAAGWLSDKSRSLHNTEIEIIRGMTGAGSSGGWSAGDVAQWIGDNYDRTLREVSGFLADGGYLVDEIGSALVDLGASASDIADALMVGINASIEDVGALLQAHGFSGELVFKALYAARRALGDPAGFALNLTLAVVQGAGYTLHEISSALHDLIDDWTDNELLDGLHLSGMRMADIAQFAVDVMGLTARIVLEKAEVWGERLDDVIAGLLESGAKLQDIVDGAVAAYNTTVDHVTEVVVSTLVGLGATAQQITDTLVTELGTSLENVAALLKASGFAGEVVFKAMYTTRVILGDPAGFALNVALAVVRGAGYTLHDISSALHDLIDEWTESELLDGLHLSGFTMADIARFAIDVMGLTARRVLEKAKAWGIPVDEVLAGLLASGAAIGDIVDEAVSVYNLTAAQLIAAMQASGQRVADFADAMMTRFGGLTVDAAVSLFRAAGYAADQVGDWLVAYLAAGGQAFERTTQFLARAGYLFDDVANWVWDRSGHIVDRTASVLRFAGYSARNVVGFLKNGAHQISSTVFAALKKAGYSAHDAADAMINVASATFIEVGGWLQQYYALGLSSTLDILDALGASLTDLIRVLVDVYQGSLQDATNLLVKYNYTAQQIIDNFV